MQGYVAVQDGAFAESSKCFRELEDWMASDEAAGLRSPAVTATTRA